MNIDVTPMMIDIDLCDERNRIAKKGPARTSSVKMAAAIASV